MIRIAVFLLFLTACGRPPLSPEQFVVGGGDLFDVTEPSDSLLIQAFDRTGKRPISKVVIHCAATPEGLDPDQAWYDRLWELNGWNNAGYHALVRLDGTVIWMQPMELPSNGARGYNYESLHISYSGGVGLNGRPKDTRTPQQKKVIKALTEALLRIHPRAKVYLHNQLNDHKACPSFYKVDDIFN